MMNFRVKCKRGVWFREINRPFLICAQVVAEVYRKQHVTPVVTSACDGWHMKNSLHYDGLAWDWRIWGLEDPRAAADEIRERLREIDPRYDVVYGDPRHLDHIHIEYDIRKEVT